MLALYNHRGLIWNFVKRDIFSKYVGSLVGLYWSVINPVITLVVYFIVFGFFLKARLPGNDNIWDFALYFSAGFLPWVAFSESVMRASRSIVANKNYIKKVPFPSEIFPVYTILSEFVNLLIGLAIFMLLFLILKGMPGIDIVFLPIGIILQMMFTLSLSFVFSGIACYIKSQHMTTKNSGIVGINGSGILNRCYSDIRVFELPFHANEKVRNMKLGIYGYVSV